MSVNDVSPEEFLGGTWERWSQGRVPVGVDESDEDFEKPNLINGEKKHTLTKDEMARHNHGFLGGSHTFLWGQGMLQYMHTVQLLNLALHLIMNYVLFKIHGIKPMTMQQM